MPDSSRALLLVSIWWNYLSTTSRPNEPCSAEVALEIYNELLQKDVPREFLTASRVILSPSFREIGVELPMWLMSSSHSSIIWDSGIQRMDSNGGTRTGLSNEQMREMLEFVEVVELNQQEPQLLTAQSDPRVGAELLVEWGAKTGIVTLGSQGCVAYDGTEFMSIPAYRAEPITTYDAVDVSVAGLAARMNRGKGLLQNSAYA